MGWNPYAVSLAAGEMAASWARDHVTAGEAAACVHATGVAAARPQLDGPDRGDDQNGEAST